MFAVNSKSIKKKEASEVKVFPNPATDIINVRFNDFSSKKFLLTDTIGRKVLESEVFNSNTKLDISHLSKGVYFLIINKHTHKIIKN